MSLTIISELINLGKELYKCGKFLYMVYRNRRKIKNKLYNKYLGWKIRFGFIDRPYLHTVDSLDELIAGKPIYPANKFRRGSLFDIVNRMNIEKSISNNTNR